MKRWLKKAGVLDILGKFLVLIVIPVVAAVITAVFVGRLGDKEAILTIEQIGLSNVHRWAGTSKTSDAPDAEEFSSLGGWFPEEVGITINGVPQERLVISEWAITNKGDVPLTASDFVRPITLATEDGETLLIVKTVAATNGPPLLDWHIESDKKSATSIPELLNPDEAIVVFVITTYSSGRIPNGELLWKTGVPGLEDLKVTSYAAQFGSPPGLVDLAVNLQGMDIYLFFLLLVVLFNAGYALAFLRKRLPHMTSVRMLWLTLNLLMSVASAEILTMVFLQCPCCVAWHACAPLLVAHFMMLVWLSLPHRAGGAVGKHEHQPGNH